MEDFYCQPVEILPKEDYNNSHGKCKAKQKKEQEEYSMSAFFASFIEYVGKAVVYAVIACLGVKAGKALRENKDAKNTSTVRINTTRR